MTPSMTCEQFENILPQLLDDDTAVTALTSVVRAHVEGCAGCRSLLQDLTALRVRAASLPTLVPSRDLWSGIAARIEAPVVPLVEGIRARPMRRQMTLRTAGVIAASLVALTTAVTYQVARLNHAEPPATDIATQAFRTGTASDTLGMSLTAMPPFGLASYFAATGGTSVPATEPAMVVQGPRQPTIVYATNQQDQPRRRESAKTVYDREVTRLRAIVDSGRSRLDPATVALLDRNLRIIDLAIEQCNQALARDSASTFLIESLNNAYQTKVRLLRIAAAAASRE